MAGTEPPAPAGPADGPRGWPALALVYNALVWGLSWWPLRALQDMGLHPLWTTAWVHGWAVLLLTLVQPGMWRTLLASGALWALALASGLTNLSFNWAVTHGDVVRVVLLFYLMPAWAVLLAWPLLGERPDAAAAGRVLLGLTGVALVLWPDGGGWPWPRDMHDWLGVAGGFCFALTNVLLRRQRAVPAAARVLAMFAGGTLAALAVAAAGFGPAHPPAATGWLLATVAIGLVLISSNVALQFGATRLPAQLTALIMLSEVFFAALSAALLGAGELTPNVLAGGLLVVLAAAWSARSGRG